MKESDLDKIVLQYLQKRRFANAERLFREEAKLAGDVAAEPTDPNMFQDLLLFNVAEGDTRRFLEEFDRLAAWIDNSLDMYRGEMSKVLWPVFLHCYLGLVKRNATAEAHQLMTKHKTRFTAAAAAATQQHTQEVRELAAVAVPQHLATSRVAQAAAGSRTHISLTGFSLELLMGFLHSARLSLVLGILNEHADFHVTEGPPAGGAQEGLDAEAEAFEAGLREVAPFNAGELRLGILQGSIEDKYQTLQAQRTKAALDSIPEADADGKPLTKKARAALVKAAEQARIAQLEAAIDRVEPAVPLPPPAHDFDAYAAAELEARQSLSSDALPSCAFLTFVNTAQALNCAAFSADGGTVAGGFADSTVRLYNLQRMADGANGGAESGVGGGRGGDGGCVTLRGHSGPVFGIDHSADGQFVFSGSSDGTVKLWSTELAANLATFRGHMFPVWDTAACPGGQYFASASADRTARVWSTERAQSLRLLAGHQADVEVVRWHPVCQYLATGSSDRSVRLWDLASGQCVRIFIGHRAPITALDFTPDGKVLAVGSEDGVVTVWDVAGARRLGAAQQHAGPVWALAASRGEGALLASGGADNTVRFWNLQEAVAAGGDAAGKAAAPAAEARPPAGVPGLLKTFQTKATPVFALHFTQRNLLLGTGALTLPPARRKPLN